MGKNVSAIVDEDVANYIEDERRKRGVLKSKAINFLLREKMLSDPDNEIKNLENKIYDNNKILEKASEARKNLLNEHGLIDNSKNISIFDENNKKNEKESKEEKKLGEVEKIKKEEGKIEEGEKAKKEEEKVITDNKSNNTNINNFLNLNNEKKDFNLNIEKKDINLTTDKKIINEIKDLKIDIKKNEVKKMSEPSENKQDLEVAYRKLRDQEKFNDTISGMKKTIESMNERICKDGDCTKRELESVRNDLNGLKEIKPELSELKNIKLELSELKNIKQDIESLKKKDELEICPECNEKKVPFLASYCPHCGIKIPEWNDDKGNKIKDWKPTWMKK